MSFLIIVSDYEYGEIEKEVKERIIRKESMDIYMLMKRILI